MSNLFIFLISLASLSILFYFAWILHLMLKNATVVDVTWGLGFVLTSYLFVLHGSGFTLRNKLLLIMIFFWALRLSTFVFKRIIFEKHEDKRYAEIREKWAPNIEWKFLILFEVQALFVAIISIPMIFISRNTAAGISLFEVLGFIVSTCAVIFEAVSDYQLQTFKEKPNNKGKVCDIGLWKYSRHPNYFFELCMWIGLFIFALGSPYGWTGVIAPAIMLYLLLNVTGIKLAEEQSLKHRGEAYRTYQQRTSMFIPLPPRNQNT